MMEIERETNGLNTVSYSSPWSAHSLESNQGLRKQTNKQHASSSQVVSGVLDSEEIDHLGTVNMFPNVQKKKRKYVKKSIEKFLKPIDKLENIQKEEEGVVPNKLFLAPIYNHITEKIDFILIGGDFFYKFSLSDEEREIFMECSNRNNRNAMSDEEKQDQLKLITHTPTIMKEYKEIVQIQKNEKFMLVQMSNKVEGLKEFQNLIRQLSDNTQELLGEPCLAALVELQKVMQGCAAIIDGIIKSYANDTDRLLQKQAKRVQYIEKLIMDRIHSNTLLQNIPSSSDHRIHQGVYSIGFINIDFIQKIPVLRKILYSKEYMAVLGLSLDDAVNQFIRQGLKECFDLQTRMRIQQAYIKTVLLHSTNQSAIAIDDINLIAFDNISIKCSGEIKLLNIELPPYLRYEETNNNEIFLEQAYLIKINIPTDLYEQVNNLRFNIKAGEHQQVTSQLFEQEEFRYSIQSQVFIEKFYQNPEQQGNQDNNMDMEKNDKQLSQLNSHQQNLIESKSCSTIKNNEEQEKVRSKFKFI